MFFKEQVYPSVKVGKITLLAIAQSRFHAGINEKLLASKQKRGKLSSGEQKALCVCVDSFFPLCASRVTVKGCSLNGFITSWT